MESRDSTVNLSSRGSRSAIFLAVPIVSLALLLLIWLISPEFYLSYVLEADERETQAVEIVTFTSALSASLLLVWSSWQLWRARRAHGWRAPILIGIIGLAAFFFAGEEVSWGQTYFAWDTPSKYRELSHETNLHNMQPEFRLPLSFRGEPIILRPSVQAMGSLFIVTVLIAMPLVWRVKRHGGLPADLAPAVAEPAVIWCVAVAFVWKFAKDLYRVAMIDHEEHRFYQDFIEQINEHKEMLVAVALLMYGVYRVRWIRANAQVR